MNREKIGRLTTPDKNEQAWDYALGLIKIDGHTPSKEFLELVKKEKNGDITTDDMLKILNAKYKVLAVESEFSIDLYE